MDTRGLTTLKCRPVVDTVRVQEEEEREKTLEIRPGGGQLKSLSHARRPSPALSH